MSFLTLSDTHIDFLDRKLQWRTYTTKKAFLTTKRIELVGKKKFVAAMLDLKSETFVIYVISLSSAMSPSSSPLDIQKFAAIALDSENNTFVVYIMLFNSIALPTLPRSIFTLPVNLK